MVTTGGTNLRDDIVRLDEPVHIVVATPGRIKDLAERGVAKLDQVTIVTMDEVRSSSVHSSTHPKADKLLSPEFTELIESLISFTHPERQILLFSATFPITIKAFADRNLKDPYEVHFSDHFSLLTHL